MLNSDPKYKSYKFKYDLDYENEYFSDPELMNDDLYYSSRFIILNENNPNDCFRCNPDGWTNVSEFVYEPSTKLGYEMAKQFLLDLGMQESNNL